MESRPRGGAPTGASKPSGSPATQTPRRTRGSSASPRLPGGAASNKARKRRRPDARRRRQVRRQQEEDKAAGAAPPCSTRLAALVAWNALGAAYWVLRTIQYGFRVPWERRPPPTRSVGYALNDDKLSWSKIEVGRSVLAGYVRRLSQAAGAGSPWVSPTFVRGARWQGAAGDRPPCHQPPHPQASLPVPAPAIISGDASTRRPPRLVGRQGRVLSRPHPPRAPEVLPFRCGRGRLRAAGAPVWDEAQPLGLDQGDAAGCGRVAVAGLPGHRLRLRLCVDRLWPAPQHRGGGDSGAPRHPGAVPAAGAAGAPD